MSYAVLCIDLLLALAFIGLGATVLRKAKPSAGYLFIGVGVLELLFSCCTGATSGDRLAEGGVDVDLISLVLAGLEVASAFNALLVTILFAVALVQLAKAAPQSS